MKKIMLSFANTQPFPCIIQNIVLKVYLNDQAIMTPKLRFLTSFWRILWFCLKIIVHLFSQEIQCKNNTSSNYILLYSPKIHVPSRYKISCPE